MLWIAGFLMSAGLALIWISHRRRTAAGLPPGRVIYIDTAHLGRLEQALYDPHTDLTGRPDYLVRKGGTIIPVEVKSGRAPAVPYPSHVHQLAAYCLLVEATQGVRPPYGVIRYANRAYAVDYTPALKEGLLETLAEMRRAERHLPDRSHDSPARCRACGYREVCDQPLD